MALSTGHHLLHELDPGDQRLMNQPVFPHLPASTTANTVKTLKLTQVEHACSFALAWWKLLVACLLVLSCHVLSATLTTPMGTSRNSDLSATLSHFVFIEFRQNASSTTNTDRSAYRRANIAFRYLQFALTIFL